jgi:hypothetical protein
MDGLDQQEGQQTSLPCYALQVSELHTQLDAKVSEATAAAALAQERGATLEAKDRTICELEGQVRGETALIQADLLSAFVWQL